MSSKHKLKIWQRTKLWLGHDNINSDKYHMDWMIETVNY